MTHIPHEELIKKIKESAKLVEIGNEFTHYKYPERIYQVIDIGIQEATENVCVIYCDKKSPDIHFVRDLDSWLETIEFEGALVPRFQPAILMS